MSIALQIKNLNKKYGKKQILTNLNLTVEKGKIIGIIGDNGEGKSTLFNCISGAINNYSGTIDVKYKLGYQPQDSEYEKSSKVIDEINLIKKIENTRVKTKADQLYFTKYKVSTLSNGMKRKLDVLQSLIGNPEILLLDEPTSGLDISSTKDIKKILINMDKTILLSSHIISDYEELCDEIYVLKQGSLTKLSKKNTDNIFALKLSKKMKLSELKNIIPVAIKISSINSTTFKLEKVNSKLMSALIKNLQKQNLFKSLNIWSELYEE